jgi:Tfp pilus assembly protein FimV
VWGKHATTTRCCASLRSPFPACPKGTRLVGMDPTHERTHEQTGDLTRPSSDRTSDHTDELTTVTVADAAELLDLSTEAVRMRVKRGTLASTKIGGTVYVLLDGPNERPNVKPNARPNTGTNVATAPMVANLQEHNTDLRDQVEHLRRELDTRNEELRRKDTIIMAMTQRIPELEAAPEPPQSSVPGEGGLGKGGEVSEDQDESQRRSWWRRILEG